MEHVVGRQSDVIGVCIGPNDDMEKRRKKSPMRFGEWTAGMA
jgi:mannose/fructose-specific phosphotransferase system component IIA